MVQRSQNKLKKIQFISWRAIFSSNSYVNQKPKIAEKWAKTRTVRRRQLLNIRNNTSAHSNEKEIQIITSPRDHCPLISLAMIKKNGYVTDWWVFWKTVFACIAGRGGGTGMASVERSLVWTIEMTIQVGLWAILLDI